MTRRPSRGGSARCRMALLAPSLLLGLGGCALALVPEATGEAESTVAPGESAAIGQSEVEAAGLESVTGTVPGSAGPAVDGLRATALGRASGPESGLELPQSVLVVLPTGTSGGFPGTLPGGGGPTAPPPGPPPPPPPPPSGGAPSGSIGSAPGAGAGAGLGSNPL